MPSSQRQMQQTQTSVDATLNGRAGCTTTFCAPQCPPKLTRSLAKALKGSKPGFRLIQGHNCETHSPIKAIALGNSSDRSDETGRTMRAVVQRVISAKVEVGGEIVSQIGPGLCVLVGILDTDTASDAEFLSRKILNMRLWDDDKKGKAWDQSVSQRGYEVLLVSQFTLYGFLKGNKPDFHVAMKPQPAKEFYEGFVERVRREYRPEMVKDGIFGAMMQVHSVNDGPVTMLLDSMGNGSLNGVSETTDQ